MSTIAQARSTNPHLAGKSRDQFIEIMKNFALLMPDKIGEPVAANMCADRADG